MSKQKEKIIATRDDGFYLTFAKWSDFPILKETFNALLESAPLGKKKFFLSWMYRNNPSMKVRIGQFLARLSLIPFFAKIIKTLYPFGYAVILKCISKDGKIAGSGSIYNFKYRSDDNGFAAIGARWIIDKYQNVGIGGSFLMDNLEKIARQEGVTRLRGMIDLDNEPSLHTLEKRGWKIIETEKDMMRYKSGPYNLKEIVKDL